MNPFADPNETIDSSPPKKASRFTTFVVPESNDNSTISTNYAQSMSLFISVKFPLLSSEDISTKIIQTPPHNDLHASQSKSNSRHTDHPVSHKPEGQQYDDFETIDWVKDIACDRDRHRRIHSDKVTRNNFASSSRRLMILVASFPMIL